MVPIMDYHRGFCEYECTQCNHVCPTGALQPLSLNTKKRTKLGAVNLFEDICVVFDKREDCGACAEVCPTHAVTTERRNSLNYPVVNDGPCIGCGSCEHACPVTPKAIVVKPAAIHGTAEKPHEENLPAPDAEEAAPEKQQEDAASKEFPF
jgi:formate hydrogenlyase subunit 6/NADH:ubiquinone oxidoreductase subunit I